MDILTAHAGSTPWAEVTTPSTAAITKKDTFIVAKSIDQELWD
jgi:hypothetical protein